MSYLNINGTDVSHLVKGLRVGYETLVADNSGRNANGDTVLDIINRKVKLYVSFRPMDGEEMATLLSSFSDYVVSVSYRDAKTNIFLEFNAWLYQGYDDARAALLQSVSKDSMI